MASGRFTTSTSLQPSSSGPPKSAAVSSMSWRLVPVAPSKINTRSAMAARYGSFDLSSLDDGEIRSGIEGKATGTTGSISQVRIYTKRGDDGTTGLLYGGRVRKDSAAIEVTGAVDEAQAALGLARAHSAGDVELNELTTTIERELYVLMAEVAT